MAEFCKTQQIVQNRIFTPKIGELADATLETQIYHVFRIVLEFQLLRVNLINAEKQNLGETQG